MSDHKIGEFIRHYRTAEIAVASGIAATAASVVAYRKIGQGMRNRRTKTQLGYEATQHEKSLTERLSLFGYTDDQSSEFNDTTRLAAFVYVDKNTAEKGASARGVREQFNFSETHLKNLLDSLYENNFIDIQGSLGGKTESGDEHVFITVQPDLIAAEEHSVVFQAAVSQRLRELLDKPRFTSGYDD